MTGTIRFFRPFGLALTVLLIFVAACRPGSDPATWPRVVVARSLSPMNAPFYVANADDLWRAHEVVVDDRTFPSARLSLDAVLSGAADFGAIADTPLALAINQAAPVEVLGPFASSDRHMQIVARRDRGIDTLRDVQGKTLGLPIGTTAEYFLDTSLASLDLSPSAVKKINLQPPDAVAAISRGSIDAAVLWPPQTVQAATALGTNAVTIPGAGYSHTFFLVAKRGLPAAQPEMVKRVVAVLADAIAAIGKDRSRALQLLAQGMNVDAATIEPVWQSYRFSLGPADMTPQVLQRQAQWALRSGYAKTVIDEEHFRRAMAPGFVPASSSSQRP